MCKWMLQLISLFLFRCLLHAHRQAKYDNGFFAPLLRHCTTIITIAIVSVSFSHTQTHRQTFRICTRTHFQIISFWIFSFSYKMSDRYSELKIYYFFPLRSEKCHNSIGCFYVIHRKMYWTFSTLCNWLKAFWCIQQLQIQLLERTLRWIFFSHSARLRIRNCWRWTKEAVTRYTKYEYMKRSVHVHTQQLTSSIAVIQQYDELHAFKPRTAVVNAVRKLMSYIETKHIQRWERYERTEIAFVSQCFLA